MSRIAEIEKLRSRMRQHHFVAISGPRNTGKSRICRELKISLESEVRNMREIERRYKAKAGMKWKVAYFRLSREDNPFDILTKAIAGPKSNILVGGDEKVDPLFESKIKSILKAPDSNGLLSVYGTFLKRRQYNFLLIIDQFENLFFSTILSQEEKHLFVNLLLNSSLNQRQIYVLVALRPPKADLWKQNFKGLNRAVETCRFRLYNPNQRELEHAIEQAFQVERVRILGDDFSDDLLAPEWLLKQDIYLRVAMPRIKNISEDTAEVMKTKWKKVLREGPSPNNRMIPASSVKHITNQLRTIADTIWPQLLNKANIGHLEQEEREDIIIDLKAQLTDVLTSELLRRMSKHLAEELYFESEPLVQIERHVRQLVKDWSEVTQDIQVEQGRRRSRIKTVLLSEQKATGALSGGVRIDQSLPLPERAEQAYMALKTTLDKRIAKKALTIMGRSARASEGSSMTLDALGYAIGRFASRLGDVMAVFVLAGAILDEPKGDMLPNTKLEMAEVSLVENWMRLKEWVYDLAPGSGGSITPDAQAVSSALNQGDAPEAEPLDLNLREDFGEVPADVAGVIQRAETLYAALAPSLRKRVAKRLFVEVAKATKGDGTVKPAAVKSSVGRFHVQLDELIEYFVRQGILEFKGPEIGFVKPQLVTDWSDLSGWMKE